MTTPAIIAAVALAQALVPLKVEQGRKAADAIDERIGQMTVDLEQARRSTGVATRRDLTGIERRLTEAETQMVLGDHWRAAVILIDVVDRPENRSHPLYTEAQFRLAEALRLSRNFRTARSHYEALLTQSRGERLQQIVEGLLAIANQTRNYEDVELYLDHLRRGSGLSGPEIDYLHGRVLFRRADTDPVQLDLALGRFRAVPSSSPLAHKAAYYAGVTLVRKEDYAEAIREFERALTLIPEGDAEPDRTARELTQLSLGRLYQETGRVTEGTAAYEEIPPQSPFFTDMLYEVAWVHVKRANLVEDPEAKRKAYEDALVSTELLMATAPSGELFAEARILQGNLQIRLGAPDTAYETFESVIERYGQDQRQVENFIARQEDTQTFFQQLIRRTVEGESELPQPLPELAVTWVLEVDSMDQVVSLERDLLDSERNLEDSEEMLRIMSEALAGEQQFRMFPGLGAVRDSLLSVQNRWLATHLEVIELERRAVVPLLTEPEMRPVDSAHAEVERLAQEIRQLPETIEQVEAGRAKIRTAFQDANIRAYKLTIRINSMRAELLAIEGWMNRQDGDLDPDERKLLEERMAKTRDLVSELETQLEALQREIRASAMLAESDSGATRSRELGDEFLAAVERELKALEPGRARAESAMVGLFARFDQQRRSLATIRQQLDSVDAQVRAHVAERVAELRQAVARESVKVEAQKREYLELAQRSERLLGPIAARTLTEVSERYDELVRKADVGVIDVAWARKQTETEKVNELIQEKQERTLALEAEFQDVLTE